MLGYFAKRVLLAIPTLLLVALLVFVLIRLIPGDPAQVMLGEGASPAAVAALHARLGLDQPVTVQFVTWLAHALTGDLGKSSITGEPVAALIVSRFQITATVVLIAIALATVIAVGFGMLAASRQHSATDVGVVAGASLILAVPSFWLGLILMLFFGVFLHWLPVVGYVPFRESPLGAILFLILPIATLTISEAGVLIRMMRSSTIEVLRLDYVTHARAKGLPERTVLLRHVFPNAFAPTLTLVGLTLGRCFGGIAVIETVFTLPGLGRLMVDSVLARDYPVVQGCLLFTAALYVFVNLIVDLLYPLFDPRVTLP